MKSRTLALCLFLAAYVLPASAATLYVDLNNPNPLSPYDTWATAATNIQDAVDAASARDQILVTNGVYRTGGRAALGSPSITNRVLVAKAVSLQSVNGAAFTSIEGYQTPITNGPAAVRCVRLSAGSSLTGFTLTNGATLDGATIEACAAGIYCEATNIPISDCVLVGNAATLWGGAVFRGTLNRCTLSNNVAFDTGGGAWQSTLLNCTLAGNRSPYGAATWACILSNCTLTANVATVGGGAYQSGLTNCTLVGNSGYRGGGVESCGLDNCTLSNNWGELGGGAIFSQLSRCLLTGNAARSQDGGGADQCTLSNCTLTGNTAQSFGGGAHSSTLFNCTLTGNSSGAWGGGAQASTLGNCTLSANSAQSGAGADSCSLSNCVVLGNSAAGIGGGVNACTLKNCAVSANLAGDAGGGATSSTLSNCTVTANSAFNSGGGVDMFTTLYNCIVYYNTAPMGSNYADNCVLNFCDASPLAAGTNNLSAPPQLASLFHLSAGSPCRAAGRAAYAVGVDIDGETWLNPPAIGCDEFHPGPVTGPLAVTIQAPYTNATPGFDLSFLALTTGAVSASRWEFGDGTIVSNVPYATHHWAVAGDYAVVLRAYNDTNPSGVTATITVHIVVSPVQYVSLANPQPIPPYTSWATAATNIQDALDAAFGGGTILVSNGVYAAGGTWSGGASNRVVVTRGVRLLSVNGAGATVIDGGGVMRCVSLEDGTSLAGFTLMNGAVIGASGGGLWCQSTAAAASNCVITANSSGGSAGGVWSGTISDCTLSRNYAGGNGGGATVSLLSHCLLLTNSAAGEGGGAEAGTLLACTVAGNSAGDSAGGLDSGSAVWSTFSGNSAVNNGGGATSSSITNCQFWGNQAGGNGGGAFSGYGWNCVFAGNGATNAGGGVYGSTLANCTLTGNSAGNVGGGSANGTLQNCILFFNEAATPAANYYGDSLDHCCTTPLPFAGPGNIADDPQLTDQGHTSASSPCRAAGSATFALGVDLDGQTWSNPPSIGCDEYYASPILGTLQLTLLAAYTNVATGFAVQFTGQVLGHANLLRWDFGDGTSITNEPYVTHSWGAPGDYIVRLRAFNDDSPPGVTATLLMHVSAPAVHYVSPTSLNPVAPFTSWATAATNIQDAVDAATQVGAMVLVTNGVYAAGARTVGGLANQLAVTNPLVVVSVNGPALTLIDGLGLNRCIYLAGGAGLAGFTLTNGATSGNGGAAYCVSQFEWLSNCVVAGSTAAGDGGGVWGGTLTSCLVVSNSAPTANSGNGGGGAQSSTLYQCTLAGNFAVNLGGGARNCVLDHCTLTGNAAPQWWYDSGGGGAAYSTLTACLLYTNTGIYGGGAYASRLEQCTVVGNSAGYDGGGVNNCTAVNDTISGNTCGGSGGGGAGGTLKQCLLAGNLAQYVGGGAASAALDHCLVSSNAAQYAGGALSGGTVANCTLAGNTSGYSAGGLDSASASNCVLTANVAAAYGGGADNSTLNNCTLTGNSAGSYAGGASGSTLANCIVFYNSAPTSANYSGSTLAFCCTTPLPAGPGNIAADPQLADLAHLSAGSPCRAAGSAAYARGVDIDDQPWGNPPSIGCDEYHAGAATGALTVAINAAFTNVTPGLQLDFIAQISGLASASRWEFDDGTILSNRPYASRTWSTLGSYPVILRAYNDTFPAGISATVVVHVVTQPLYYVAQSNATPAAPFASWATAATNIQDAVDAATTAGALVLVSNGVYAAGARRVNNDVPHRVVLNKPVIVQSVNGPAATRIEGHDWSDPVRCAFLGGRAVLAGFTLTNGAALPPWSETSSQDRSGGGVWCDSITAVVSNCVIVACGVGDSGGGAYGGSLVDCTFLNNYAGSQGGATYLSTLIGCTVLTNNASAGGGVAASSLARCFLAGNTAGSGGGASFSSLTNCTLSGNAAGVGAGADNCTLIGCSLNRNGASDQGGGASASTLYNSTLTGNSATNSGGGVVGCTLFNSIVYFNFAPAGANWATSSFDHCGTLPLPAAGAGNLAADPQLADSFHLSAGSPCRGAGSAAYALAQDLDGESWLNPPAVGCDEYRAGTITGALGVAIEAPYTNVAAGFSLDLAALITGHANASLWNFGDGTVVSNRPYCAHAWATPGNYVLEARVFNESFPAGVSTTLTVQVQAPVHYVALDNPTPAAPYASWATAATNLQDAVDATFVGGTVIVSNGLYQTGAALANGILSNRVAVIRQMTLTSVNGPAVTIVQGLNTIGSNAVRCVSLARNSVLSGFTLINGGTRNDGDGDRDQTGAGVWCESLSVVISNCVLTGNNANGGGGAQRGTLRYCVLSTNVNAGAVNAVLDHCQVVGNTGSGVGSCTLSNCTLLANSGGYGGASSGCTLNNCLISSNSASYGGAGYACAMNNCLLLGNTAYQGGGTYNCSMYNCTLVGNYASGAGGGAFIANTLENCILYYNSSPNGANYYSDYLSHCCTTPAYGSNAGNITNAPLFVDLAGGNFRLQPASPCINSGANASAPTGPDLEGNPRIVLGTADIGAYEFQGAGIGFTAWLQQYGQATDGSADFADPDHDGLNNYQEWIAGTIPTNGLSVLRLLNVTRGVGGVTVTWQSVSNRAYTLLRSTGLGAPLFQPLATHIPGVAGVTSFTDSNAVGSGPFFYRVAVEANAQSAAGSVISYAWLQQYGLPTDGSADYADPDHDGMNNYQEWRCDTVPTNAASLLKMLNSTPTNNPPGMNVSWASVATRFYSIQRSTNLAAPFLTLATNVPGLAGSTSFLDTNAPLANPLFYRVSVQP